MHGFKEFTLELSLGCITGFLMTVVVITDVILQQTGDTLATLNT